MKQEEFLTACENGDENSISLSLKQGLDPNFEYNETTPLNQAIKGNHPHLVKLLIDAGANVNFPVSNKETAILISAWFGNVDILKTLIDHGANPFELDRANNSVISRASEYTNATFLKTLIEVGGKSFDYCGGQSGWTPLIHAAYKGKTDIVEMLLDNGVTINAETPKGQTALMLASDRNRVDTVRLLLEADADLHKGVNEKHYSYGKGSNTSPLNIAAYGGYTEIVRLLLAHGATVDDPGKDDGKTALHISAIQRYYEIVKELIKYGADIYLKDGYGSTIFSLAEENGFLAKLEEVVGAKQPTKVNIQTTMDIPAILNAISSALENMSINKSYKNFQIDEGICYLVDDQGNSELLIELEEEDGYDHDLYHESLSQYDDVMLEVFNRLNSSEIFKKSELSNLTLIISRHDA